MSFSRALRIGTRGSLLALWQARWVQSRLQAVHPGLEVVLEIIKTQGDKILDVPLAQVGGKGLFVKELEEAMLEDRTDLAVHSMKDVPAEFPPGLGLAAVLEREDPRDALLSVHFNSLDELPQGARVGSSSLRRQSQIKRLRPDLQVVSLRGNVNTRIAKLEAGEFDAILLAAAGVKRLAMTQQVKQYLEPDQMLPAIGQGAVGVEARLGDEAVLALLRPLDHAPTRICVEAERAFLATLEGGCQVPIAGHAQWQGDALRLQGLVGDLEGRRVVEETMEGSASDPAALGVALAHRLLDQGAAAILADVYHGAAVRT
ncbi:MAG: hydroxymethylbilane synthase [Magnetococcales bacterium]|nr:hydroxymethylbilane synthase [Magnetococcales bacterium]